MTQKKPDLNKYTILTAAKAATFIESLNDLEGKILEYLATERQEGRELLSSKTFLSDIPNQLPVLKESSLYKDILADKRFTAVGQPPLCGSKVATLVCTGEDDGSLFHSIRLDEEESYGKDSHEQTLLLFRKYLGILDSLGLSLEVNCVRTWIYVSDIDNNYAGVVRARNEIFKEHGLTPDTHFIASTGIGGKSPARSAVVSMDFLTYPGIKEEDKFYLKALDHLNPTHEYGVSFERGTRLTLPGRERFLVSGTASIDCHGKVLNEGNVLKQADRLLENIDALLKAGGSTLKDARYFIVYLRDVADFSLVDEYMRTHKPSKPYLIVEAPVCRPTWLIEMECEA